MSWYATVASRRWSGTELAEAGCTEHATGADGVPTEVVPFSEAQPSPDGAYWRCKRPDGSRRYFFAPPPNT